jgi:hypothetical protein
MDEWSSGVAAPLLYRSQLHEGSDRSTFIGVAFDHHLSAQTDPTPLAHECSPAEQVRLDAQAVKAPHVVRWIDPAHLHGSRKDV